MQRSLDRFGVVDVDRIFNSGLRVRVEGSVQMTFYRVESTKGAAS